MNLLLKEELISKCADKDVLKDVFDDLDFLDKIKNKKISELSKEEKEFFNEIVDFLRETTLTTIYMFLDDYYIKIRYKIISIFLIKMCRNFYNTNKEYYDMVQGYSRRLEEIEYALDSIDRLEITDIKLLYELVFLTFITSINDLAIFDYNMLNKNKYSDSDLEDLSALKSGAKSYELSLITLNRKIRKINGK